ncbi:hypothetical protein BDF19DRAFT_495866 [Syncephalis fuscata]|nr:hypothetical protein BDF19DRAFT_495866 [Syncephalis fuscata]
MNHLPPGIAWGLNPLFWLNVKLLCKQVHELTTGPTNGIYILNKTHLIQKVSLVGVVTAVELRRGMHLYTVDDGTDCVVTVYWLNKYKINVDDNNTTTAVDQASHKKIILPSVGDLVLVSGRLTEFNDERQIDIGDLAVTNDPNAESLHWLEVLQLERDIYSKPPFVPEEVIERQPAIEQCIWESAKRFGKATGTIGDSQSITNSQQSNINTANGSTIDTIDGHSDPSNIEAVNVVGTSKNWEPHLLANRLNTPEGLKIVMQKYINTRINQVPYEIEDSRSSTQFRGHCTISLHQLRQYRFIYSIASSIVAAEYSQTGTTNTTNDNNERSSSTRLTTEEKRQQIDVAIKEHLVYLFLWIYACIVPQGNLARRVRQYLYEATRLLSSSCPGGIRAEFIHARIKSEKNFAEVSKRAVIEALNYLQEQGDAYETSRNVFKAIE